MYDHETEKALAKLEPVFEACGLDASEFSFSVNVDGMLGTHSLHADCPALDVTMLMVDGDVIECSVCLQLAGYSDHGWSGSVTDCVHYLQSIEAKYLIDSFPL